MYGDVPRLAHPKAASDLTREPGEGSEAGARLGSARANRVRAPRSGAGGHFRPAVLAGYYCSRWELPDEPRHRWAARQG